MMIGNDKSGECDENNHAGGSEEDKEMEFVDHDHDDRKMISDECDETRTRDSQVGSLTSLPSTGQ